MRFPWFKGLLIVAALFIASGNAHAFAHQAMAKADHCAAVQHHEAGHHPAPGQSGHDECCCSCLNCPSGLIALLDMTSLSSIVYSLDLAPARAVPLTSRVLSPELDPPRPIALG